VSLGTRTQNGGLYGFSCLPIYEYLNICPLKHSSSRRKDPREEIFLFVAIESIKNSILSDIK
jgi:hypothetical protein